MPLVQRPKVVTPRILQRTVEPPYDGGLADNMKWSQLALDFVLSAVPVASNKLWDEIETVGMAAVCVTTSRTVYNILGLVDKPGSRRGVITRLADIALVSGCGNCGEQSSLAFEYLDDNGISPLDWMCRTNGDHAFVVIGRAVKSDVSKASSWGGRAVVCDPWKEQAYIASEIENRNGKHWIYGSMYSTP